MLCRKSQSALEFIMTYGWAILVVIVAVSTLAYFGVLSPDAFLPQACRLPAGISCLDYKVESYRAIVVLQNTRGETITITKIIVSNSDQQCFDNESITLNNNDKAIFTVLQCNNGINGQKFNGNINISFDVEDKLPHTMTGTIRDKVVAGSSVSSQSVCQNAQDSGLCSGLDIVFGAGYQAACCSEYSLCCS